MSENKEARSEMNEAWEQIGKTVNEATELYLKELEAYLGWAQNARKEMLEQTIAASQQLWRMGEAQYAFFTRMQKESPLFGWLPKWTEMMEHAGVAAPKRPGRAT